MFETYRKKHQNRQSADWLVDADGKPLGLIGPEGKVYQPVIAETSPGGGVELSAGGSALSVFQRALRFAFPMQFESGSEPARDSSGRGTQIVISDSQPWEGGWLKGASTNTRQISASAMGVDLATDSFVVSFIYRAAAGLTSTLLGTASSGAFSSSVGYGFFLVIVGDKIGVRIRCAEGGTLSCNGATTVQDEAPHAVQLVWDAQTKTVRLYVDGVIDASGVAATADVSAPVTGPMQISGAASGNGNAGHRFAGVQMFVFKQDRLPSSADDLLIKLATRPREVPVNFL